jgi:tetratricopeptide (TPR) repeat protein
MCSLFRSSSGAVVRTFFVCLSVVLVSSVAISLPALSQSSVSGGPAEEKQTSAPAKGTKASPQRGKPADIPPPKGLNQAVKLYSASKFDLAAKQFQKFIKDGVADVNTHAYLAYCLYNMKMYTKALKEFDWVAKNATHSITLQRSAENSARTLRCYMSGVCPGNCLKANDPRWHHAHVQGHPDTDLWIDFHYAHGSKSWSQNHIGDVIEYVNGEPTNKGTCPICGGTTRVAVLKDGDPVPH